MLKVSIKWRIFNGTEAVDINDYGDIRGGDDNGMRGYDGYSDGPQDDYEEEEELSTDDEDRIYNKAYEIVSQRWKGDREFTGDFNNSICITSEISCRISFLV